MNTVGTSPAFYPSYPTGVPKINIIRKYTPLAKTDSTKKVQIG